MNGISLMACVQERYGGGRPGGIVTDKYIALTRRGEGPRGRGDMTDVLPSAAHEEEPLFAKGGRIDEAVSGDLPRPGRRRIRGIYVRGADSGEDSRPERGRRGKALPVRNGRSKKAPAASAPEGSARCGTHAAAARLLLLAVVFSAMLAGFQIRTRAHSRPAQPVWKYYTTVEIGYGEDLNDIVHTYCDASSCSGADAYVREVCEINSLPYTEGKVPDLRPGARIVIPYWSTVLK